MNVNPTSRTVYVPPRPNPGPEPLPERPTGTATPLAVAVLALAAVVLARRWRRRRRAKPPAPAPAPRPPDDSVESPRERMIAWSLAIRETLAGRFGPAWRAKTTEEIGADPGLIDVLGPDSTAQLVEFLAAADRAKFAGADEIPPPAVPESYLRELAERVAAPAADAGAKSTIRGK